MGVYMTTAELTNKLKEYTDIDDFMQENGDAFDENALQDFLEEMLTRKGFNATKLAVDSGISIPYTFDLYKGRKRHPRKDTLIKLAFGLNLSLDETNRLLTLGGVAELRSKNRRESILIFCFVNGYNAETADELLSKHGQDGISRLT
jgi:hypothetical protein